MKTSEVMDLINELEARYHVDQWQFDGINIWPFLRIRLSFDLFNAYYASSPSASIAATSFTARLVWLANKSIKYAFAFFKDFRKNSWPINKTDVVLISDGVSYTLLEDAWYEKFCDPLISVLEIKKLTTFLLSPLHEYLVPRHSASLFIQPCIDLITIKNFFFSRTGKFSSVFSREYSDCCEYLLSRNIPATLMDPNLINTYVRQIQGISRLYCSLLKRLKPTIVFNVSYYGIEGMAANLACRELNIPSVDIQHGFQGDLHVAYARWNKIPVSGYELLPQYFWCWTESDAETINKWSNSISSRHRAIVGGNLWLSQWLTNGQDFVEHYDKQLKRIVAQYPDHRHILVTLQTSLASDKVLAPLLNAVSSGPKNWRWWFRLHPCMLQEREKVRKLLGNHGIVDVEFDIATDYPLYALLRHMDLHITHSSSTVIEAVSFGIPSVITSEYGAEFFPNQLQSGWAVTAYSTEEILTAIDRQLNARAALSTTATSSANDAETAIDKLMSYTHM